MGIIWILSIFGVVGFLFYRADKNIKSRFDDKFNPHEWNLPETANQDAPQSTQVHTAFATPVVEPSAVEPQALLKYTTKPLTLSPYCRDFYPQLHHALAPQYAIFTQVPLSDFLAQQGAQANMKSPAAIRADVVDFLLCNPKNLRPVCVIQLADSQNPFAANKAQKAILQSANLPYVEFNTNEVMSAEVIAKRIQDIVSVELDVENNEPTPSESNSGNQFVKSELKSAEVENLMANPQETFAENTTQETSGLEIKLCPKCAAVMLKRKAKTGVQAGKYFWACSTYPACKGILPI